MDFKWFKLWFSNYYDDLFIQDLDEIYTPEEQSKIISEVGKAFINAINYAHTLSCEDENDFLIYKFDNKVKDGHKLYLSLKRAIKQAKREYNENQNIS